MAAVARYSWDEWDGKSLAHAEELSESPRRVREEEDPRIHRRWGCIVSRFGLPAQSAVPKGDEEKHQHGAHEAET